MHVAPDGGVFMSGTNAQSFFLDTRDQGTWTPLANGERANGARDYAPSVMYDEGKVLYVGGGHNVSKNCVGGPSWANHGSSKLWRGRTPCDAGQRSASGKCSIVAR
jgi:hypothetical protein